jgi:predicted nucleic acid-binding protein
MIHLDTGFLVRVLVPGTVQDRRTRDWLAAGEDLGMSTIAWAELLCGPMNDEQRVLAMRLISSRVPLGERDAALAARLFNETGRRRGSLADCMIAATAIGEDAALATDNTADFRRFATSGLRLAV